MTKSVIVVGAGLGGLSTALRLSYKGYQVTMIEKQDIPGGRLHLLKKDGFTFDVGPSFFSMSYEFKELFDSIGEPIPFELNELNPLYTVNMAGSDRVFQIYKDLDRLAEEFKGIESDFETKVRGYLKGAKEIFHDTEYKIIKRNFDNIVTYAMSMATVPLKHLPKMFRTFWEELERHFESEEVKIIFSLVAFFLGATPFNTPSVYNLLNYTELEHDGYWNVKGGMYKIVEGIMGLLEKKGVKMIYNTEIMSVQHSAGKMVSVTDANGQVYRADLFVINADAAWFRGKFLNRAKYTEEKLDKMEWTLAPFTIYLGVKGTIPGIHHHNYYLGDNFRAYADTIFRSTVAPEKPYYYVNVASKSNPNCAPEGCENLFILCPVPDMRVKPDWSDSGKLVDEIIEDLGKRVNFDIKNNILTQVVYTPIEWQKMFNLYKGSGLGLAHGLNQIGALRPANKDEKLSNVYYVGASTHPGTGLPIVVIGSRLVTERIVNEH
ncbi:MAG: phytoene desaturase family protein [Bacteroidota bacterium]|nr:phytoene desaturase family protein [Bacteroidota bacterium]